MSNWSVYLECDGSEYDKVTYSELYSIIGDFPYKLPDITAHKSPNGKTNTPQKQPSPPSPLVHIVRGGNFAFVSPLSQYVRGGLGG